MKLVGFYPPRHLHFDVTHACNNRCVFCGTTSGRTRGNELTSVELLPILQNALESGIGHVSFLGGEPFLKRKLADLLRLCFSNKAIVVISTNGSLLDADYQSLLVSNAAFVGNLQVSLHAADRDKYEKIHGRDNFPAVLGNLASMARRKLPFTIAFVAGRHNQEELLPVWRLASNLGADYLFLSMLQAFGRGESMSDAHLEEMELLDLLSLANTAMEKDSSLCRVVYSTRPLLAQHLSRAFPRIEFTGADCTAARTLLHLEPDGSVTPCPFLRNISVLNGAFARYGAKYSDLSDFGLIWNSPQFAEFRGLFAPSNQAYDSCRQCEFFSTGRCTPCPLANLRNNDCLGFLARMQQWSPHGETA